MEVRIMNRKICLALPSNRLCLEAIEHLANEVNLANQQPGVQAIGLILDTSNQIDGGLNKQKCEQLGARLYYFNEPAQRQLMQQRGVSPRLIKQLLPDQCSYGAATNRLFLFAHWLGCESVHRRDSDSAYQMEGEDYIYPITLELAHLFNDRVESSWQLDEPLPAHPLAPNWFVGSSFIGPASVALQDLQRQAPEQLSNVMQLTTNVSIDTEALLRGFDSIGEAHLTDEVALGPRHNLRVDMCNIAMRDVYKRLPLPNFTEAIGSDYFALELYKRAGFQPVLHNRHIVNQYLDDRCEAGLRAYQHKFVRYILYTSWFNHMADFAQSIFPDTYEVDVVALNRAAIGAYAATKQQTQAHLQVVIRNYQQAGGLYAQIASELDCDDIMQWYQQQCSEYVDLLMAWPLLINTQANSPLVGMYSTYTDTLVTASAG